MSSYPIEHCFPCITQPQGDCEVLVIFLERVSQSSESRTLAKDRCKVSFDSLTRRLMLTLRRLHSNVVKQWDILEQRLAQPGQHYIALPDRPSLADISYFPYAMPWMFDFLEVGIEKYPQIKAWGERMMSRPAVRSVVTRGPTYGHGI